MKISVKTLKKSEILHKFALGGGWGGGRLILRTNNLFYITLYILTDIHIFENLLGLYN